MSDAAPAASDATTTTDATATADAGAATVDTSTTTAADAGTLLTGEATSTTTDATKTDTEATAKDGDGQDDGAKKEDTKTGAPEEYAAFELPESLKVDEAALGEFKTLAKELNLSQESAQKLVTFQANLQKGNAEAFVTEQQAIVSKAAQEWVKSAKADAEIGGAKFDENMGVAKKALDTFGSPELKTLLKESRLGNHPEVIRFMFKAGQAISQDGFVPGRASSASKDAASVLYGTTTSK